MYYVINLYDFNGTLSISITTVESNFCLKDKLTF